MHSQRLCSADAGPLVSQRSLSCATLMRVQSGSMTRKSFSGESVLGEPEAGSDAAALAKLRGHWLLPAVGKPAAAAVLAELKVQRIADGGWLHSL